MDKKLIAPCGINGGIYRTKYNMSMIENLEYIRENGLEIFVDKEKKRWACDGCGGTICVHRGFCLYCKGK